MESVGWAQAVHGGADLRSAAATVMGFKQETMKGKPVAVAPVPNVANPRLQRLLDLCISQQTSPGLVRTRMPLVAVALWTMRVGQHHAMCCIYMRQLRGCLVVFGVLARARLQMYPA